MSRVRDLKLPRRALPIPLASALRLFGFNWRGKRSRNGNLWMIYRYGTPATSYNRWELHTDADPGALVKWLYQLREARRAQYARTRQVTTAESVLRGVIMAEIIDRHAVRFGRLQALDNLLTLYGMRRSDSAFGEGFLIYDPADAYRVQWISLDDSEESWLESVKLLAR